jgi:hypothetical protein
MLSVVRFNAVAPFVEVSHFINKRGKQFFKADLGCIDA